MSKTLTVANWHSDDVIIEVDDDFQLPSQIDGWFYFSGTETSVAMPAMSVASLTVSVGERIHA